MNEQIFDWGENSEKILRGEGYSTFHSRFKEQVAVVRYLLDKGFTKEEVYEEWKKTKPKDILYADDEHEKKEVFGRVWRKAQRWVNRFYSSVTIYQEEVDFINNMSVIMWIKQYILTLLCVYKYYRQTWCCYTNRIKCFCYSQTYVLNEREEYTLKMCECLKNYAPYTTVIHDSNVAFKMNFAQALGTPLATIKNPSQAQELFKYLKDTRVCSQCGKTFEVNSAKLRRDICKECYRKNRHAKQYRAQKARRKKNAQHFTTNQ